MDVLEKGGAMYCARCGMVGGAKIFIHVFVHIFDLILAASVAAVVAGASVEKLGWKGMVLGAVFGMGLGSFRERGLRRARGAGTRGECG
jgi:hypothetical protein